MRIPNFKKVLVLAAMLASATVFGAGEQTGRIFGTITEAASGAQLQAAERALQSALGAARAEGAVADGCVRISQAHQQIGEAARELGADLLVLSRHGTEGLARAWVGGVAQKVIGLAPCPVLISIASNDTHHE